MDKKVISLLDLRILVEIYTSLSGENWSRNDGWRDISNEEELHRERKMFKKWYGVECSEGNVVSIQLERNNLSGKLPKSISKLKKLRILKLRNNPDLRGKVPKGMYSSSSLMYCYLDNTRVKVNLPTEIAHTFQITQYKDRQVSVSFLVGKNSRWTAEIDENEMAQIFSNLHLKRCPPKKTEHIQRTAFNATGPERTEAAIKLQQIYRGKLARRRLREVLKSVYEKHIDNETGEEFYVNTKTGETSWDRPVLLKDTKLASEEKEIEMKMEEEKEEDRNDWEEIGDGWGNTYFYNKITGESRWDAPKFRSKIDEELIRRYGKDTDPEERYRLLFLDVDKDNTGEIDKHEFECLCGELGMPMSDEHIDRVMKELDTSGDGLLSQEELTKWLKHSFND